MHVKQNLTKHLFLSVYLSFATYITICTIKKFQYLPLIWNTDKIFKVVFLMTYIYIIAENPSKLRKKLLIQNSLFFILSNISKVIFEEKQVWKLLFIDY